MWKATTAILAGAMPAGVVTYWMLTAVADRSTQNGELGTQQAQLAVPERELQPRSPVAEAQLPALAAYESAAGVDDAAALEALIASALAEPFSPARDNRVGASFRRLAALDLRRALDLAAHPAIDAALLASVVRAAAEENVDVVLATLADVAEPRTRLLAAASVLEAVGNDASGVERVAAALPEFQRIDFQAAALARRAVDDPYTAIGSALALRDDSARNTSVQRIALEWARRDPIAALTRAETLPNELRARFIENVSEEWARLDTAAFLSYAEGLSSLDGLQQGLNTATAVDPRRGYALTLRHPGLTIAEQGFGGIPMERAAFASVVQLDPLAMLAEIDRLPDPRQAATLRSQFAAVYGRTDPEAAIAWARSFDPPQPGLEAQVIGQAALMDIDRAIVWFGELEAGPSGAAVSGFVASNVALYAANHPRRTEIATRLRARSDDPRMADLLQRITARWINIDPAGMLDWMLTGGGAVDAALASNAAAQLAQRDAGLAAAYVERMPSELRGVWLEQVAAPYARQDPERAAGWLGQFQAEPGYENILRDVVREAAETDPRAAARLLEVAPASVQAGAIRNVAAAWARDDLGAAGRWAAELQTSELRDNAVEEVASAWAYRAPDAAQRWAMGLPNGETRDAALTAIVSRFASEGYDVPIDRRFLAAFESDAQRERAVVRLVGVIATTDPAGAESLLDDWVSDATLRRAGTQAIEAARSQR